MHPSQFKTLHDNSTVVQIGVKYTMIVTNLLQWLP